MDFPTSRHQQLDDPSSRVQHATHDGIVHHYENVPVNVPSGRGVAESYNRNTLESAGTRSELRVDSQYQTLDDPVTTAAANSRIGPFHPAGVDHSRQAPNLAHSVGLEHNQQPAPNPAHSVGLEHNRQAPNPAHSVGLEHSRQNFNSSHSVGTHQTYNPPTYSMATERAQQPYANGTSNHPERSLYPPSHLGNTERAQYPPSNSGATERAQYPPSNLGATERAQYPPSNPGATERVKYPSNHPQHPPSHLGATERAQHPPVATEHAQRPFSPSNHSVGTERAQQGFSPTPPTERAQDYHTAHQKESEIHLLRMNVTDKDAQIGKLTRDLDHCHCQIKQLNNLLTDKKEDILGYQDQIAGMRAELAELRDTAMSAGPGGGRGPQAPGSNTQAEQALQMQVEQLSRQNTDMHRQLEQLKRQLEEQRRHNEYLAENGGDRMEVQRLRIQLDQARMDSGGSYRQNSDLKTRIEMLELQVLTFKEDFDHERSDRERAQAELHETKEENENLKQALNMLATEHGIQLGPTGLPLQRN